MTEEDRKVLNELSSLARKLETASQVEANEIRRTRSGWLNRYVRSLINDEPRWEEIRLTLHQNLQEELFRLERCYEEAWDRYEGIAFVIALRDWAHGRYAAFNQSRAGARFMAITPATQYLSTRNALAAHAAKNNLSDLKLYLTAYEAALHFTSRAVYREVPGLNGGADREAVL